MAEEAPGSQTAGYAMRGLQGPMIERMGRAIVGGEYAPGDPLPTEADLGEEFGVSRTSVREAMRVLAAKGLVDIRRKVGTRVRPTDQWNAFDVDIFRWHGEEGRGEQILRDLVEVRQIVEPQAARLAGGRATIEDLRHIDEAHQRMRDAIDDPDAYSRADVAFHQAVYAASHNDLLRQLGAVIADFLQLSFDVQQRTATEDELRDDVERHGVVARVIQSGNGERAAESMLEVVLDGKNALIRNLRLRAQQEPGAGGR